MAVAAMSQETRSQQHAIFVIEELERARSQSAATGAATAKDPLRQSAAGAAARRSLAAEATTTGTFLKWPRLP